MRFPAPIEPVLRGYSSFSQRLCRIPHRQVPCRRPSYAAGGSGARSARAVSWVRYPAQRRERVQVQLDRSRMSRRNLLLAALPAQDFALLAPHLKEVVLEQGVVLQEQGDRIDQVYFPHDGIISLLAVLRHGDAIETATIGYEGAVGSFAGLGVRRSHTRAVVQVRGAALRIAASPFRHVGEGSN